MNCLRSLCLCVSLGGIVSAEAFGETDLNTHVSLEEVSDFYSDLFGIDITAEIPPITHLRDDPSSSGDSWFGTGPDDSAVRVDVIVASTPIRVDSFDLSSLDIEAQVGATINNVHYRIATANIFTPLGERCVSMTVWEFQPPDKPFDRWAFVIDDLGPAQSFERMTVVEPADVDIAPAPEDEHPEPPGDDPEPEDPCFECLETWARTMSAIAQQYQDALDESDREYTREVADIRSDTDQQLDLLHIARLEGATDRAGRFLLIEIGAGAAGGVIVYKNPPLGIAAGLLIVPIYEVSDMADEMVRFTEQQNQILDAEARRLVQALVDRRNREQAAAADRERAEEQALRDLHDCCTDHECWFCDDDQNGGGGGGTKRESMVAPVTVQ